MHEIQRFRVLGELGRGGMGRVYRAIDPRLEREVAIKIVANPATRVMSDRSTRETVALSTPARPPSDLLAEARMMARLSHPNVVAVYEVGVVDDGLFVVMEHVAGRDLAAWLATPRDLPEILDVLAQAGRGLAAAHACGIVHRDVKPQNVLVGVDGRVRVADFGLSQLQGRGRGAFVRLASTVGTPGYMAPELLRGRRATRAADVFAFATTAAEALRRHDVPPSLRAAIAAGLVDDPRARCRIGQLVAALEAVLGTVLAMRQRSACTAVRSTRASRRPTSRCGASTATVVAAAAVGEGTRRHRACT